ncbi:MAG TPA: hypothetical protein VE967_06960 [Gemmatimonadaceae bacterium]|nr:hypothetical protein [Gemmatimonadaceae bacterium]
MAFDRSKMTVRVVPLSDQRAGDARVAGTAADRIALVRELSERGWSLTGRPLPSYTRATMPVVITSLASHGQPDSER